MLQFYGSENSSDPNEEQVTLLAGAAINLKGYAIVDKTFDEKGIETDTYRHIFIFPSLLVQKGEFVRLFSGKGKYEKSPNKSGSFTHKFYWNSEGCIWNNKGDTATLLKYEIKNTHIVAPIPKK